MAGRIRTTRIAQNDRNLEVYNSSASPQQVNIETGALPICLTIAGRRRLCDNATINCESQMLPVFRTFLEAHQNEIVTDTHDQLQKSAEPAVSPASLRILESIGISADGHSLAYDQLSKWVLGADGKTLYRADLALPIPAAPVHFVAGAYNIYYDFKNTDIVLDELQQAGVQIQGALLDFGCSSGRNLAVLRRAYGDGLDLYGVDPAGASIDWLNANVRGVQASVSRQEPPLPFEDSKFDIIIASIHARHKMDSAQMTARLLRALKSPFFKIWGHPLGRLIPSRPPFACHMEKVLDAIAEARCAV